MNYIEVNGAGLRYELSGAGAQTLVLVHEMGGTLESWDHVLPRLAGTRRILRYDTRGAGMSQKIRGDLSIDTMADDIAALLDALGIKGKVALCGVSVMVAALAPFFRIPRIDDMRPVGAIGRHIAIGVEQVALAVALEDAAEVPAVAVIVGELGIPIAVVDVIDIAQELDIGP